ncbi:MAG: hypothetical protein J5654_09575 [Victivallales bacterium]|nr:hypothetical protein [Victivallales bacterium]
MTYQEYIKYHLQGDAGVEERTLAKIANSISLDDWQKFCLIYFYCVTYNIPSAIRLLKNNNLSEDNLQFRTDRRWIKMNHLLPKMVNELKQAKYDNILSCKTAQEALDKCLKWFYFARYSAFLFLEAYWNMFAPSWCDDVIFRWEPDENYTIGAKIITRSSDKQILNSFLHNVKCDTGDNSFSIETSLCAVAKIEKGTRWNGYYTQRMIEEAQKSEFENLIINNIG